VQDLDRIVFLGSGPFGVPSLSALASSGRFDVTLVLTRPDAAAGRGLRTRCPPVASEAERLSLPLVRSDRLDSGIAGRISSLRPALLLTADFGLLIPPGLLSMAPGGVVNIHPSLLPRHRGAEPVAWTILDGDGETGVSFLRSDEGWDTGPLIFAARTQVAEGETAGELEERLAALAAGWIVTVLDAYLGGRMEPRPQEGEASRARRIPRRMLDMDWGRSCTELERTVLAFSPRPGARTLFRGRSVKLLRARAAGSEGSPGAVISVSAEGIEVACGSGSLVVTHLQPESRPAMSAAAFAAGYRPLPGERLGAP